MSVRSQQAEGAGGKGGTHVLEEHSRHTQMETCHSSYLNPQPVPPRTMAASRMAPATEPIMILVPLGPVGLKLKLKPFACSISFSPFLTAGSMSLFFLFNHFAPLD